MKVSEVTVKMSEICYQIRLVYICTSKPLDEALLVSHFFSMKTLDKELVLLPSLRALEVHVLPWPALTFN